MQTKGESYTMFNHKQQENDKRDVLIDKIYNGTNKSSVDEHAVINGNDWRNLDKQNMDKIEFVFTPKGSNVFYQDYSKNTKNTNTEKDPWERSFNKNDWNASKNNLADKPIETERYVLAVSNISYWSLYLKPNHYISRQVLKLALPGITKEQLVIKSNIEEDSVKIDILKNETVDVLTALYEAIPTIPINITIALRTNVTVKELYLKNGVLELHLYKKEPKDYIITHTISK